MYGKDLEFGGIKSTDYQRTWMKSYPTGYSDKSSWKSQLSLFKLYQSIHMCKTTVTSYLNKCVKMLENSMNKEPCEIVFNGMSTKSKLSMIEFLHHLGLDPFISSCSDETIILVDVSTLTNHGIGKQALVNFLKHKVFRENAHIIQKDASTSVPPSRKNSSCNVNRRLSCYNVNKVKTDLSRRAYWVHTSSKLMQEDGKTKKQLAKESDHNIEVKKIEQCLHNKTVESLHDRSISSKHSTHTKVCVNNEEEGENQTKRKLKLSKLKKLLKKLLWKKGNVKKKTGSHGNISTFNLNDEKVDNCSHIPSENNLAKPEQMKDLTRTQSIRVIKEVNSDDLFRKSSFLLTKKQAFLTEYNKKYSQYATSDSSIFYEQCQLSNKIQDVRDQATNSIGSKTTYRLSKTRKKNAEEDTFNIGDILINSMKYIKQVVVKKSQSNNGQKNAIWCGEDRKTPSKSVSTRQTSFQIPYEYNKKSINKGLSVLSVTTDYAPGCCPKAKNYFSYFSDFLVNKFIER